METSKPLAYHGREFDKKLGISKSTRYSIQDPKLPQYEPAWPLPVTLVGALDRIPRPQNWVAWLASRPRTRVVRQAEVSHDESTDSILAFVEIIDLILKSDDGRISVMLHKTTPNHIISWDKTREITVVQERTQMLFNHPFPIDSLPCPIRDSLVETVQITHAPLEVAFLVQLTTAATACQGLIDVQRKDGLIGPVNIFATAIAERSSRKSSSEKLFGRYSSQV